MTLTMSPPSVPLLPYQKVVNCVLIKKSECISLMRTHAFLHAFLKDEAQGLRLSLSGAFIAIRTTSAAIIIRRLLPSEGAARTGGAWVLTEGGAEGAGEEHPLESVLEDDPTEEQWKEACAEFVKGIMQGQLGHIFMREIKATSERLARLQRCTDVLAVYGAVAPGQGPGGSQDGDLDVRLYDGLRYALRAPAMHEGIWSRWCTELRKCIWGLESAQRVASHGCLDSPAQQLPEQQPLSLEQHQTLKQEWPPEQAHQPLPPVQQAPLDPTWANGGDGAQDPVGGSARGEWQTHRHADGHVGAASAQARVCSGAAATGEAPLPRGGAARPAAVPAAPSPAAACDVPVTLPASDLNAGGLSVAVRGEKPGAGKDVLPLPAPPISPVSGATAVQDTGATAACDESPREVDDAAFLHRRRHSGLNFHARSCSRSPPRPPSPLFPPSPRRRKYDMTVHDAEGSSQRTLPQLRPPRRYRSRSRSRSGSRSGSWSRSRSPRRLEHGSRPRSGSRSASPRPHGPNGPGNGGGGYLTPRGSGGGVLGVSDRPYRPPGEPRTWTSKEWSEAVLRFLKSQPGGCAEVVQLRRVGLEIPPHLLDLSGRRPSGFLYSFPKLWTVSEKSTTARGMTLTALPSATEAHADGGAGGAVGSGSTSGEPQERRRRRDREERERETEEEWERERARGRERKRERRELDGEQGQPQGRAGGRPDGCDDGGCGDIPLVGMSSHEAAYVSRLVKLLRTMPQGVATPDLRRHHLLVPPEVHGGRKVTQWFKRHRNLWHVSMDKPVMVQLRSQYMPAPTGGR
ncbi:hypothetical protein PLESTB_000201200 [Pleodorina starrii]|uniref:Uncharacterized protein n=1 Tax=Pleodorina starrii TaxID=330485 RepID=A0A9W6EXT2_9CHLO|nr:hypothetical protein PLESTM_000330600 [Pleodorina starrii]GLC49273.1 hypothetical protein PLESTB_000201200 [Pleodorina starrii]GLC73473.1 hypothetical protein PLESTF_001381700 [Pleodorina starrii]